jgi:hypothetical protein
MLSQKICTVCETLKTQVLRSPYSTFSSSCLWNDPKLPTRVMRFVTVWWLLLMISVTCTSYPGTVGMPPFVVVQPPVSCRFRILIFSVYSIQKATPSSCGTDDLANNQQLILDPKRACMLSVFAFFCVFSLIWYLLRNKEMLKRRYCLKDVQVCGWII